MIAGFGFRGIATIDSLESALELATGNDVVSAFAAPVDKCAAPCFQALAQRHGVKIIPVDRDDLKNVETLSHSAKVFEKRGTGSVAEAAVLSACGPNAQLLGPRVVSEDRLATCALAMEILE